MIQDWFNAGVRAFVRSALWVYYKDIQVHGREHLKKDKPLMVLANHQNGLIDPLVIGTYSGLYPYYLARADVFNHALIHRILRYLRMMPIYRLRDGRDFAQKNEEIYQRCAQIIRKNDPLLLFPEGGHGRKRKVRPLKNGFIHILSKTLAQDPEIDVWIQPMGVNYTNLTEFPDRVRLYIAPAIRVKDYWQEGEDQTLLKQAVFDSICRCTVHIEDLSHHDRLVSQAMASGLDITRAPEVNEYLQQLPLDVSDIEVDTQVTQKIPWILRLMWWPIWWLWPKMFPANSTEPEMRSTFRLTWSVLAALFSYVLIGVLGTLAGSSYQAISLALGLHALLTLWWIKKKAD
jgi:1-acyl-sn-glycerol-3-phosphate acyltransferase